MRDHLVERLPRVPPERIDTMLRERLIVDHAGPLAPDAPYRPATYLWFHRDLPVEAPVPFAIDVVHRDEHLVVVDKPHFLASIPRGAHILETALVRLRRDLGLPDLSAAHRLDRMTAGLLMFVVRREDRGAYQTLFRDRAVGKTYLAVARHDPAVELPRTVRSRIIKERGIVRATEVPGEPNAETRVELLDHRADLGLYRLSPRTGRTHQLRLHMAGLGLPLLGDDFYPELTDRPLDDFRDPLQLLAATLEFTDPITGRARRFASRRRLAAWADAPDGAPVRAPGAGPLD
jgi:tRNA pseudouridine32 synthase / 23S rRNA pseudouridine746 synthase